MTIIGKYSPYHMSVGNCKLKQWDTKGGGDLIRMSKMPNTNTKKVWWGCRAIGTLIIAIGNVEWYSNFGGVFQFIKVNVLLHLIQKSCSFVFTQMLLKLCAQKSAHGYFRAALYTIARNQDELGWKYKDI